MTRTPRLHVYARPSSSGRVYTVSRARRQRSSTQWPLSRRSADLPGAHRPLIMMRCGQVCSGGEAKITDLSFRHRGHVCARGATCSAPACGATAGARSTAVGNIRAVAAPSAGSANTEPRAENAATGQRCRLTRVGTRGYDRARHRAPRRPCPPPSPRRLWQHSVSTAAARLGLPYEHGTRAGECVCAQAHSSVRFLPPAGPWTVLVGPDRAGAEKCRAPASPSEFARPRTGCSAAPSRARLRRHGDSTQPRRLRPPRALTRRRATP